MGGELLIDSELGKGTHVSFQVYAPMLLETSKTQTSTAHGKKVLLAEDDSDIADLVVMMMSERGVDITHVENGALALESMSEQSFDLVLMDINMPVMTGYEALEQLQKDNSKTPVVIMSASTVDADRAKAEFLGCYDYLVKPVDVNDILQIMNGIIG